MRCPFSLPSALFDVSSHRRFVDTFVEAVTSTARKVDTAAAASPEPTQRPETPQEAAAGEEGSEHKGSSEGENEPSGGSAAAKDAEKEEEKGEQPTVAAAQLEAKEQENDGEADDAAAAAATNQRINAILANFFALLYRRVLQGLFEKHKTVFSLLLAKRIQVSGTATAPSNGP